MAEQFGKYQLIRRIGAGGMAEVFLARTAVAQGLAKELVIKKIHPAYARSRHFVSMFVAEAKIALGLNHPNIVQVFDFGAVGNTYFLAMEYIEGLDLLRLLQHSVAARRRIPAGLCAHIVREVAKALDYAHRKSDEFGEPLGIVHRDVSPQNILVSWDGAVKLVDFGVARARGVHEDGGLIMGKYAYMSPEQARGDAVDARSDLYSAGIVLFELVCGRPLFPGRGREILDRVKSGSIPAPRDIDPTIPAVLENILLCALAFAPDDRYASARDLQTALGKFQLDQAKKDSASGIIDSEALARFLSEVKAGEGTAPGQRGGFADDLAGGAGALLADPGSGLSGVARAALSTGASPFMHFDSSPSEPDASPKPPGEVRERKHVLITEGHIAGPGGMIAAGGAAAAQAVAGEFFKIARDIAFKYHAQVHAVGDDTITLLTGVPVAEEDDASRTIRMALDLIDALRSIAQDRDVAVRLSIGIQRGSAIVSRTSDGLASVDMAQHETQLAGYLARNGGPGEVLIGARVYRLARADWYFDELRYGDLHGAAGPDEDSAAGDAAASTAAGGPGRTAEIPPTMSVYRLRRPKERSAQLRERQAAASNLVGRDLELKALRDAYRDVQTSGGKRVILIAGEAGAGKRALVNAFLSGIPASEAVVRRATGYVATAYTPYAIVGDLLRDLLGLAEDASPREARRRIERVVAMLYTQDSGSREGRGAGAGLAMLLGIEPPSGAAGGAVEPVAGGAAEPAAGGPDGALAASDSAGFDSDELRQRLLDAMLRVERHTSSSQVLILIGEDVHWADDDSIELCRQFFGSATRRPVLGIFTSRPDSRIARVATELDADIMRLDELDIDSAIKLITRRFVPGSEVAERARQIVAHTGGNPLFIREVIDSLVDRGIVVAEAGPPDPERPPGPSKRSERARQARDSRDARLLRWVDRDASIQVPTSIDALLATRFDHLPAGEKETLLHAAVLGRKSRADVVSALLGRPAGGDLEALVARGLFTRSEARGDDRSSDHYQFRNNMSMSVAYSLLPAKERARLHERAAAYISEQPGYRQGSDLAVIARHLELAGNAAAAVDHYLVAASHAIEVGGSGDALRQLERAIKLLPAGDHRRRFAVHRQREDILGRLARRPEQLREIRQLLAAAEALGEPGALALAHTRLAQLHIDSGNLEAAARAATAASGHARASGDRLAQAHATLLHATIARLVGKGDEALVLCDEALALCDDHSPAGKAERALILNNRGGALWNMGKLEPAIEAFAEGLVIYRGLAMPRKEAGALNNMGIIFASMGEFEEALAHGKSALEIAQKLGDRASIAAMLANIGQTYADIGDAERAERYLAKAIKIAERADSPGTVTDALVSLGQVYLERGEHDRATRVLERGLAMARAGQARYEEIRALIYLALVALEAGGSAEQALGQARTAAELAEAMPMPLGQIFGLAVQGLALARAGQAEDAVRASARAVALQASQHFPESAEQIFFIHAQLCHALGQTDEAHEAIRAAEREVETKSLRLADGVLRAVYLDSRIPRAILRTYAQWLD